MEALKKEIVEDSKNRVERILQCKTEIVPVMDAIYVINGKWRVPITIALMEGNKRFSEIQKEVSKITAKVLSQQLKEMELNGFIDKKISTDDKIKIEYELTKYSWAIKPLIIALRDFGIQHRERLREERNH